MNDLCDIQVSEGFKTLRSGRTWAPRPLTDVKSNNLQDNFQDTLKDKKDKIDLASENSDNTILKKYAFKNSHSRSSNNDKEAGEKILQIESAKDVLSRANRRRKRVKELMEIIFNETGFSKAKDSFKYGSDLEDRDIEKELKALAKVAASIHRRDKSKEKAKIIKCDTILLGKREIQIQNLESCEKIAKDLQDIWDWKNAYEVMKAARNSGDEVHLFDRQLRSLGLQEITPLHQNSKEFKALTGYIPH
ncbi:poly (ADP-ribose) polymerase [Fusarium proliferatum]|nr:poly (ADP-ribose) polymerase [Fusarium proliferatum]